MVRSISQGKKHTNNTKQPSINTWYTHSFQFAVLLHEIHVFPWLKMIWRWLPHRLSQRQLPTTVSLRTPITQMIIFNQGMLLHTTSNHFLTYVFHHIYIYICLYPSSTGLSSTHITTSSQLAWLLNWSSTAPASQCSGFESQFRPEYFRPAFSLLFEWR